MDSIKQVIESVVSKSNKNTQKSEGDYNVDGLLYCRKCHQPKQKIVTILGEDYIVGVMCKCSHEEMKAKRDLEAKYEFEKKVEYNRKNSGLSLVQQAHTFESAVITPDNQRQLKLCRNYSEKFSEMFKRSQGLLLYGPPGTGKSFFSFCIANKLLAEGLSVKVESTVSIAGKSAFYKDHDEYEEEYIMPDLFILDDLGAERKTDYALERVHDIVEYRVSSGKPMIVTTNYSLKQMKEETDLRKIRTFDRIFNCCFPIPFTGSSFRKKNASDTYAEIKDILEG